MSLQTLEFYSSELGHYDARDIEAAVRKLMYTKREPGETAFPDLQTLDECIRAGKNARLRAEREQRERDEDEALRRDREEHPENYFGLADLLRDLAQQKGFDVLPPKKPVKAAADAGSLAQLIAEVFTADQLEAITEIAKQREALKKQVG